MAFEDLVARADRAAQVHLGGTPVVYQPASGPAVTVTGLFDEQGVAVDTAGEGDVELLGPSVWLRLEDLPTDPKVDNPRLTIKGKTYKVKARMPDGTGGIRLGLHRVGA